MKKFFLFVFYLALLVGAAMLLRPVVEIVEHSVYPLKYSEFVEKQSTIHGVDKSLVYAVIHCESGFKPDAVSSVGARGLMQITEDTFDWIKWKMGDDFSGDTYDDMFDPETNITYGTFMLGALIEEFGTIDNTLCAYHAGWNNAKNWLKNPEYSPDGENITNIPFGDTKKYVNKVTEVMDKYKSLYFYEKE